MSRLKLLASDEHAIRRSVGRSSCPSYGQPLPECPQKVGVVLGTPQKCIAQKTRSGNRFVRRKQAIIYVRIGLADDLDVLVRQAEAWAKRHRIVVTEIIVEASQRQPRLLSLLSRIRSKRTLPDVIVSPSIYHFSNLPKFLHTLARLEATGTGVGFVKEDLLLHANAPKMLWLQKVASDFINAEKFGRSQAIKQSLRIAAIYGRKLGKPQLSFAIRREAEQHLQAGKSLRGVVAAMNGKISRTAVAKLRKELNKRDCG